MLNEFVCFIGMSLGIYALSGLSPVVTTSINAVQPIFMLIFCGILTCFACSKETLVRKLKFNDFKSQQNLSGDDQD